MLKKLLSVSGFTLLSRITGFARDALQAWTLGAGFLGDAFVVAFLFPNYFRAIFGEGTINPAFLPRYAALKAKGEHAEAAKFANAVFAWQLAAQIVLLVLAIAFMPQIIGLIAPGWSGERLAMTVAFARITFPYLIMTLVAVQLSAMLNAIDRFWAGAFWSNLQNLAMIATLLLWHWFPNAGYAAAWGVFIGGVAQLVFILWAGTRDGLWLKIEWPRLSPQIKEFFVAFGAVVLGSFSIVISPFIDTILASLLPIGSRTALYYADRINQLPLGVLGIALGTVLLPEMSARLAKGDTAGSSAAQNRSAAMSLLLTLPFMVTFLVIPGTIVRGVFLHGAFDSHAAQLSSFALMAYGAGLPAMAMLRIVQATFYARHDTATPARATVIALVTNAALKVLFVWFLHWGVAGLALGTALGAWINVALLTVTGRSRALLAIEKQFVQALAPALLAALGCGVGARIGAGLGQMALPGHYADVAGLVAAMLCAAVLYGGTVLLFRNRLPLRRA